MRAEPDIEEPQDNYLRTHAASMARDLEAARASLWKAVAGLTERGEKLEKLANLGTDLSEYAGELHRVARSRHRTLKFRVLLTLSLSVFCCISTALWIYILSEPSKQ